MTTSRAPLTIVLIGMMGSGKTTVGRAVAARTGWPYMDNDELVHGVTGREPAEIDAAFAALRRKYGWQMRVADLLATLSGRIRNRAVIRIQL